MMSDLGLIYNNNGNGALLDLLSSSPGRILDCGCGPGDNARILNERGWHVTGVTIDAREQEAARKRESCAILPILAISKRSSAGRGQRVRRHLSQRGSATAGAGQPVMSLTPA